MKAQFTTQQYLERVLLVCEYSGHRRRGIFKCMDENRNILRVLKEYKIDLEEHAWLEGCVELHDLFFENLLRALRPTYPDVGTAVLGKQPNYPQDWTGRDYSRQLRLFEDAPTENLDACLQRVLLVCQQELGNSGYYYNELLKRIDANREFYDFMQEHTEIFEACQFVRLWIELNDMFFVDLKRALKGLCDQEKEYFPRPWTGATYTDILIRFDQLQAQLQGKHHE